MSDLMLKCSNCQSDNFYLQDGLYFCEECNVQYANLVEMEYDGIGDNFTAMHRIKLRTDKVKTAEKLKGK